MEGEQMEDSGRFIAPGSITLVIAPRGFGKTTMLERWVRATHTPEKRSALIAPATKALLEALADPRLRNLAVDHIVPSDESHRALVEDIVAAHRDGRLGTVVLAARDCLLGEQLRAMEPDMLPPERLVVSEAEIRGLGASRGVTIDLARLAFLQNFAGGIPWPTSLAVDVLAEDAALSEHEVASITLRRIADDLAGLQLSSAGRAVLTKELWDTATARLVSAEFPDSIVAAEREGLARRVNGSAHAVVPVYAEALRTLPQSPESAVALRDGQQRVLDALIAQERFSEAVDVALGMDDPAACYRVAVDATQSMSLQTQGLLARRLQGKPHSWFAGYPNLAAMVGLVGRVELYSHLEWQPILAEFIARERVPTPTPLDRLVDQWVHGIVLRLRGDLQGSRDQVARSLSTVETLRREAKTSNGVAASALHSASITLLLSEEYVDAERAAVESVRLARMENRSEAIFVHSAWLAACRAISGDIRGAADALAAIPPGSDARVMSHQNYFQHVAATYIAFEAADGPSAAAALRTAKPLTERAEHWWLVDVLEAKHRNLVDGADGSTLLNTALNAGARVPRTITAPEFVLAQQIELALEEGRTGVARMQLRKAGDSVGARMLRAALLLAEGDPSSAMDMTLREQSCPAPRQELVRLLVGATAALRIGSSDLGTELLKRAADTMRQWDLRTPLRLLSTADHTVLRGASDNLGGAALKTLTRGMRLHPGAPIAQFTIGISLTRSEERILYAVQRSATLATVASTLGLSRNTVKTQLRSLYRKLGASSRTEALARAATAGYLDAGLSD